MLCFQLKYTTNTTTTTSVTAPLLHLLSLSQVHDNRLQSLPEALAELHNLQKLNLGCVT